MHYYFREKRNYYALVFFNTFLYGFTLYKYFTIPPLKTIPSVFDMMQMGQQYVPGFLLFLTILTTIVSAFTVYISIMRAMYILQNSEDLKDGLITLVLGLVFLYGTIQLPFLIFNKFTGVIALGLITFFFILSIQSNQKS
jgi:hypothetical protein